MEWIERLNHAIGYIDRNLDGEISYDEISRITLTPIGLFQRFFVLATNGVTLAEYIRRRKLTHALVDLQKSNAKVIDTAIKYGYESPDAFAVAFKRLYGIAPSQAKKAKHLKHYGRIYFTLTISYVKGENDMVLLNIDKYQYYEPLFEGVRIILNSLGEPYTPEYIMGISGAAFKIAGGCPSRPTCVYDRWTDDFIRFMGYEISNYPCFDENENDITEAMVEAVKKSIDDGKPALVWNAFSMAEYDVVCGYDDEAKQFVGRHANKWDDEYAREPWDRAKTCDVAPVFGAVIFGKKTGNLNKKEAEIQSIVNAVKHAESEADDEGLKFYRTWAAEFAQEGRERGMADAYCHFVYASVRKAAVAYLHSLVEGYDTAIIDQFRYAAADFQRESDVLDKMYPLISWSSPWGVDEERSKNLAPLIKEASEHYEKGIGYLKKALELLNVQ